MVAAFAASAGDVVSFNYEFGTDDYIPYQDFSYYSVNGVTTSLAVVGVDTPNYGKTTGVVNYTITDTDITNAAGSNIQFSVGIMDALDTCVESYLKLSNFSVSASGSTPADINSNGLLDGLDAYMVSANLENVSESVKLTDSASETIGNSTSDNWNIDGTVATTVDNLLSGFDILASGTGSNVGKVAVWTADADGVLTESIDEMDSSDQWVTIEEAIDSGYEEKFGKDFNNDGLISSASNSAGITLKNGSSTSDNVQLVDADGNAITQAGTSNFTVEKSLSSSGFSLFNTESTGYQVLVKGTGSKSYQWGISEVDQTGMMGDIDWSAKDYDDLESKFNTDLNGDNIISSSTSYKINDGDTNVTIKTTKGVALSDNSNSNWDALAATKTSSGTFKVLLEGAQASSKYGQVFAYSTDKNGTLTNGSGWKDVASAVDSGWESGYKSDLDGNGLIVGGSSYKLSSSIGAIEFTNKKGIALSSNSSKSWDAIAAAQTSSGTFKVLAEGEGSKSGQVYAFSTDKAGSLTKGGSGWKSISSAVASGWESDYKLDLDDDGLISGGSSYKLKSSKGPVTFKNKKGKALNSNSSKSWDAIAAVQTKSGFQVLCDGEGSKNGKVVVFSTDNNGFITKGSGWMNEKAFYNTTDIFDFVSPDI